LQHRTPEDLDFFTSVPLDVEEPYGSLVDSIDAFVTQRLAPEAGNLAVIIGSTKVEFSDASSNPLTEPTEAIAGAEVGGLGDLLAMKLSAITKCKQLRDYDDLRAIEQIARRRVEEGLALAVRRYRLRDAASLVVFEMALGRVGECAPDPLLPTPREELVSYWSDGQPKWWPGRAAGTSRCSTTTKPRPCSAPCHTTRTAVAAKPQLADGVTKCWALYFVE
jgi:hypothetical protein